MLEPCAGKLARTVLKGESGREPRDLPGKNMEIKTHTSWEDFINDDSIDKQVHDVSGSESFHISDTLYRGHKESEWDLLTTLERFTKATYSVGGYLALMISVSRIVESHTDRNWNIDCQNPFAIESNNHEPPPYCEFMVYLRHHGFPSPLLDWSRSPYIAAFFAFRDAIPKPETYVAIYSFVEWAGRAKGGIASHPQIWSIGKYIKTHKRHYLQQAEYTVCRRMVEKDYLYCSHEDAMKDQHRKHDLCFKHLIPTTEKDKVLKVLQSMNINDYSLFATEDSLMRMLAIEEIDDKKDF